MHLRQPKLVDVASRLVGVPVVGTPIRIERTEEPLHPDDLLQTAKPTQRPFFLDEEGGIDLDGRIIQRHNQIPLTVGHLLMGRAILMQHHAW
jgi:hypothetical protein